MSHKPKIHFIFLLLLVLPCSSSFSQFGPAWDSIKKITEQDHQYMMGLLNITSLRPGVNGMDPNAPNAANYDESKANPYPNLPDPLVLKDGRKVDNNRLKAVGCRLLGCRLPGLRTALSQNRRTAELL